jgi:hypothetical protein
MAFIRTKNQRGKNGKIYQYRTIEFRWREGGRVRSKSVHIKKGGRGRFGDYGSPAMLLNEDTMRENKEALARGWAVDPLSGQSNEPPTGNTQGNQAAQRDEDSAEYGDPGSEAEAAAGGPVGGPAGE